MVAFLGLMFPFMTGGEQEGKHEELGSEFIMHHITDHAIIKIHLFGIDLSITKHVLMMWIVSAILIVTLSWLFRKPRLVPKGLANFFEFIIVYLEEEVMRPFLGEHSHRYAPYLLTAFFFILLCNLMGLVPGAATATGDISVTAALALLTFVTVQVAGIKSHGLIGYFKGLIPPGLPLFILPIMIPVEVIGMFTKHFALAIRLFANMVAGHVVIFALLLIIFTFKSWLVGGITLGGILFVGLLEILIALIQAYIFTILSAVFIGMAVHQEH
ncbi:F0F1 ATP synthase subunit A [candidate division KSB1 bacterium]|nr:F0F1 ATP synthase subunit A [candidate division KSB1 bacterium]NIR72742.1 F0F1 ATP synthase subunit A [candidate division KSB1 bacterium]NIS26830.1 F0F1 ATP synthase subunit A [candidate division KSB1 bacterium]NIT73624.1 F0F1 ATP synthase subunit A [candidate division KSB1 bacterium]NIU27497.1 F0F1 ATP synthase subunit A [candidate division KSB1 bacterium]